MIPHPAVFFTAANLIKAQETTLALALGDLLDAIGEDIQSGRPLCPPEVLALAGVVVEATGVAE